MPTTTPDWKLKCFHWLPLGRWTVDNLIAFGVINGNRYCKVCDGSVPNNEAELEKHVQQHIKEENARQDKIKKENALAAKIAREEAAKERKLAKENYAAVNAEPKAPKEDKAPKKRGRPRNPRTPESVVDSKLREFLGKHGAATATRLVEATGIEIASVRSWLKKSGEQDGLYKSGKQGRPAPLYRLAKSSKKEA